MKKVLVIEDNALNRELAEQILEDDFEVLTAENGELGLEVLRLHRPDIVLMDLSMPVLDGWTALVRMRRDARYKNIPVVAVSAHVHEAEIARALAHGFDDYVTKPLDDERLLTVIRQLLKRAEQAQSDNE